MQNIANIGSLTFSGGKPVSSVVSVFTPASISGLEYWFDAADSPAWTDNGTTPAGNGSAVYRWDDISGNSRHLVQTTAGSRPTYVYAGAGSGSNELGFDGTSDFMATSGFTFNQPFTVVIGVFPEGYTANDVIFDGASLLTGALYFTVNSYEVSMTSSSGGNVVQTLVADPNIVTCGFSGASSYINVYQNGGNIVTDTGNPGTNGAGGLTLGSASGGLLISPISVYFVLGYSKLLSPAEITNIQTWAKDKYTVIT